MKLEQALQQHRRQLRGKSFQMLDGTDRRGVIISVQGLFFPRKNDIIGLDEKGDPVVITPAGPYMKVKWNMPGNKVSFTEEINGAELDKVNVP